MVLIYSPLPFSLPPWHSPPIVVVETIKYSRVLTINNNLFFCSPSAAIRYTSSLWSPIFYLKRDCCCDSSECAMAAAAPKNGNSDQPINDIKTNWKTNNIHPHTHKFVSRVVAGLVHVVEAVNFQFPAFSLKPSPRRPMIYDLINKMISFLPIFSRSSWVVVVLHIHRYTPTPRTVSRRRDENFWTLWWWKSHAVSVNIEKSRRARELVLLIISSSKVVRKNLFPLFFFCFLPKCICVSGDIFWGGRESVLSDLRFRVNSKKTYRVKILCLTRHFPLLSRSHRVPLSTSDIPRFSSFVFIRSELCCCCQFESDIFKRENLKSKTFSNSWSSSLIYFFDNCCLSSSRRLEWRVMVSDW